jgi:hypothetical protein
LNIYTFGATFGKVVTKKQTIFGYRLHLLITLGGLILDFEMTPANATDLEAGFEMLSEPYHLKTSVTPMGRRQWRILLVSPGKLKMSASEHFRKETPGGECDAGETGCPGANGKLEPDSAR